MATDPDRITSPERQPEDADAALRPKTLDVSDAATLDALVQLTVRKAAK